ncbi:MAG: nicotinate-nucleotide adenylyltransferase [Holophagaceae bacterium]|nr:nicotinate-nucleotide adenylyltransferase [Holophagaceae bacterium]
MKRIGLLGGAFNPPHLGHLRLAELALEHLELDEVRFIPTHISPHKPTEGPASEVRLGLIEEALAASGHPFRVESLEIDRGGTSYTVDTLEALQAREPDAAWIFLVGSDQLAILPTWYRLERILELASMAVAPRPEFEAQVPNALAPRVKPHWSGCPGEMVFLPGTQLALASSQIRHNLSEGLVASGLPPQVLNAIQRESLYR